MRRALGISLVVGLLAVTGCDSDEQPGGAPAAPPSTSATPPATTAPDGPAGAEPPVLPDLARQKSAAGAKAFVRYYVEVLNYSWLELHEGPVTNASTAECQSCSDTRAEIRRLKRSGGFVRDGQWSVVKVVVVPGTTPAHPSLLAEIRIAKGTWRSQRDTPVKKTPAGSARAQVNLAWKFDHWLIDRMRATE